MVDFRQTLESFNESRQVDWDSVIHYVSDEDEGEDESLSSISESPSSVSTMTSFEEKPVRALPVIKWENGQAIKTGYRTPAKEKENYRFKKDLHDIEQNMKKCSVRTPNIRRIGKTDFSISII